MSTVLQATDLAAGYGDIKVVWNVSFEVEPGRVTAILGRNGAGKTTTMRALSGLIRASSGSITLGGADVTNLPAYKRVTRGLAYVQEGKRIFRRRTVEENLLLGGYPIRLRRRDAQASVDKAYLRFPILGRRRKELAGILSGGQQQMLAIAQALVREPSVILLDEPSAGLAPSIVGDVLEVVRQLRTDGLGVLLVEQSVDFALAVADRVHVMDLGRIAYSSDREVPGIRAAIEDAYFGNSLSR